MYITTKDQKTICRLLIWVTIVTWIYCHQATVCYLEPIKIDIREITPEKLQNIPGIGPHKAHTIYRKLQRHWSCQNWQQIAEKAGISSYLSQRMQRFIIVQSEEK